jgi:hypothetical protein
MADMQRRTAHDGETLALQQIIDRAHGAVRAVFDGQHAELAQAGFHRVKHRLKAFDIHDVATRQNLVAGRLRVRALDTLTRDRARTREHLFRRCQRTFDLCSHA